MQAQLWFNSRAVRLLGLSAYMISPFTMNCIDHCPLIAKNFAFVSRVSEMQGVNVKK